VCSSDLGCGGGEGHKETSVPEVVPADCSLCHDQDIAGTHYDSGTTTPIEGYILNNVVSWAPEGMGYVTLASEKKCSASCHDYHSGDISINNKWFKSGHADLNAEAFTHNFTDGKCLRCHSGIGFASYVDQSNAAYPDWSAPTEEIKPHHITCNACHDADGYPNNTNKRLRKTGSVALISGSSETFVQDAVIEGGDAASCFVCHQGLESGWSLFKTLKSKGIDPYDSKDDTITNLSFVNPHYYSTGAMLFSKKGFEFQGKTYSYGNIFHQKALCTGCHMAESEDEDLGGHTFNVIYGDKMLISACQGCHPDLSDFKTFRLFDRDMDGDGIVENIKEEIEGLESLITAELEKAQIYYNSSAYPYFFTVPSQQTFANRVTTWKESQIEAAFNLQFVNKELGAYIHNFKYAVQLLRDSYEVLSGSALPGVRPTSSDDRPAQDYTN
jgi:hypothetical protein